MSITKAELEKLRTLTQEYAYLEASGGGYNPLVIAKLLSSYEAAVKVIEFYSKRESWKGSGKYNDVIDIGDVSEYHGGCRAREFLKGLKDE